MKRTLGVLFAMTVVAVGAAPALATTNLFTPITGDAFAVYNGNVGYNGGGSVENFGTGVATVEASLGHAQGGSNSFTVEGYNGGGQLLCQVLGYSGTSGVGYGAQNYVTATGYFSMAINTSFPSADLFYTIECYFPAGSSIAGVIPNH